MDDLERVLRRAVGVKDAPGSAGEDEVDQQTIALNDDAALIARMLGALR